MHRFDLAGDWRLSIPGRGACIPGKLPGCQYLDMMAAGLLADPFWGENEAEAKELGREDCTYTRRFALPEELARLPHVELVVSGVDTLAAFWLNGQLLGKTENAFRTWRFDLRSHLVGQENELCIQFQNPYLYMTERYAKDPLPAMTIGAREIMHIRKPPYHFGWDWGPTLPPMGITGSIGIEAWDTVRLEDLRISQNHGGKTVTIDVEADLQGEDARIMAHLTGPDGREWQSGGITAANGMANVSIVVEDPELWWPNGLGAQPLYTLRITLEGEGAVLLDEWTGRIGLRTLTLDTSADKWGNRFQFVVNGVPVFAKGANWIPSDNFVTRTTRETLAHLIDDAKAANMNMLRVWGGGYYESDAFYDLCDEAGILVWQDFIFACMAYPFHDTAFVENLHQEVQEQIRRLRSHASLALFCGNNEIMLISLLWRRNRALTAGVNQFFFETLRDWTRREAPQSSYWPGSPASGSAGERANDLGKGDTHLWQVWHGMLPPEAFERFPTRFCSEFGMESLPSMRAIRRFTSEEDISVYSPVMLAHQKSTGGNHKMLFYMLQRYRNPSSLREFLYLSQLSQAETVRIAVENWRRKAERCHGVLYWQFNDCWPTASWSGIDSMGQWKALHYRARHFYAPRTLSVQMKRGEAVLYMLNDLPRAFTGHVRWETQDFSGKGLAYGKLALTAPPAGAVQIGRLKNALLLNKADKREAVLSTTLLDDRGTALCTQYTLFVAERAARLPKAKLTAQVSVENGEARVTVSTSAFAKAVFVDCAALDTPFSDNFFDLPAHTDMTIRARMPEDLTKDAFEKGLSLYSLCDVVPKNTRFFDHLIRLRIRLMKRSLLSWLLFKFI